MELVPDADAASPRRLAGHRRAAPEACQSRAFSRYRAEVDRIRPGSDGLHHILANALLLVNRVEEAQSHLKQALTLNPGNALAASDLAAVHEHFGRLDEALELYRAAARIDPSLEEARESALRVSERLAGR